MENNEKLHLQFVLFTHDDMDGAGCRIMYEVAHWHMEKGEDYEVYNCSNSNIDFMVNKALEDERIDKDHTVLDFADICCSYTLMQHLIDLGFNVRVFDHHKTNLPILTLLPDAMIVPENAMGQQQSGTSLLYQHYVAAELPYSRYFYRENSKLLAELVNNIREYDTWEWKTTNNMNAKYLATLFFMLGMDKFVNRYVDRIIYHRDTKLIDDHDMEFVDSKIQSEKKAIDNFTIDDVYPITIRGHKFALVLYTKGASISELAYQFLKRYPEFEGMVGFSLVNNGKFDFRTVRDDFDLGCEIARPIGGGGHPQAAGASLDTIHQSMLVDMLVDMLNETLVDDSSDMINELQG